MLPVAISHREPLVSLNLSSDCNPKNASFAEPHNLRGVRIEMPQQHFRGEALGMADSAWGTPGVGSVPLALRLPLHVEAFWDELTERVRA